MDCLGTSYTITILNLNVLYINSITTSAEYLVVQQLVYNLLQFLFVTVFLNN